MPKKKRVDATQARRRRFGGEPGLQEVPRANAPEQRGRTTDASGTASQASSAAHEQAGLAFEKTSAKIEPMPEPTPATKPHHQPQPESSAEAKLPGLPERPPTSADLTDEQWSVALTATKHCLLTYPTLYTAGVPELAAAGASQVWLVPIVLRFPITGTIGTVGEIRIDAHSGKVIDSTPSSEAVAKGRALYEDKSGADSSPSVQPNERG